MWLQIRFPVTSFMPPLPRCFAWKSQTNSLTTSHCAHCLNFTWRVGFCHHSVLSHSSLCFPLLQEPGICCSCVSILWCLCRILRIESVSVCLIAGPVHTMQLRILISTHLLTWHLCLACLVLQPVKYNSLVTVPVDVRCFITDFFSRELKFSGYSIYNIYYMQSVWVITCIVFGIHYV